MKKRLFTAWIFFFLVSGAKAQYVTITDTAMVRFLTDSYLYAMVGNQMDTTHPMIVNETFIGIPSFDYEIANLDGIQYFDNALTLWAGSGHGELTTIPAFPPNLTTIYISDNHLTSLPALPVGLKTLECVENQLDSLPELPNTLEVLLCFWNNLTFLPELPNSLLNLSCEYNNLTEMPELPNLLSELRCYFNNLSVLPELPNSLILLHCGGNNLTNMPELPSSLIYFSCDENNLSVLPELPNSIFQFSCSGNNLNSIPNLPSILYSLDVRNNENLSCLPILPNNLEIIYVNGTDISCLPNFPTDLVEIDFLGIPLCLPNNILGCLSTNAISGSVYNNSNNDCVNGLDLVTNTTFHLYDNQNNLLQSRSSSNDNNYYFSILPGQYSVQVDSSFLPSSVSITCPISVVQSVSAVQDSSYTDRDFGFNCTGTDLGVQAIVHQGIVFPGQPHSVKAIAGDLSNYFGLNCAAGTSGTVQLNINGPVTYSGFPATSLAPSVSGNTYLYTIADFATTNLQQTFVLNFLTDTTAQAGDSIAVTATIISDSLDLDSTNNTLSYTYIVVNSYDPNMKEVNPVDVLPGYDDYFTYTVHFQNLGSAPAFNIRIKDTLDGNLDLKTLRVINASHNYSFNLTDDLLTVYFQNIMLADSASNPEGSKGFVQYQVKPQANLPLGTLIENTAHIFFDFNEAVVTNTTTNKYVEKTILPSVPLTSYSIHPNPSSGNITIVNKNIGNEMLNVRIHDLMGKSLVSEALNFKNGVSSLNTDLVSGSYFLVIENGAGVLSSYRLVIRK